jgi:hypothetical protein
VSSGVSAKPSGGASKNGLAPAVSARIVAFEERPRARRQRPDRGVPVGFGKQRRGTAGGMVPRLILALENHHLMRGGKEIAGRCARDSGPGDDDVAALHVADSARGQCRL